MLCLYYMFYFHCYKRVEVNLEYIINENNNNKKRYISNFKHLLKLLCYCS